MKVASCIDTAIDPAKSDILEYKLTRKSECISELPDKQITWFQIRVLSHAELQKQGIATYEDLFLYCFENGVVDIENLASDEAQYEQKLEIGSIVWQISSLPPNANWEFITPKHIEDIFWIVLSQYYGIVQD